MILRQQKWDSLGVYVNTWLPVNTIARAPMKSVGGWQAGSETDKHFFILFPALLG